MMPFVIANGELFRFPELSWWILHVVGIIVVFTLGCLYGQRYAAKRAKRAAKPDAPAGT